MTTHTTLSAGEICRNPLFDARDGADINRSHVRTLAAVITQGTHVPPLLVWPNTDPETGLTRFTLLDGHHRLAAYACLKKTDAIPVRMFEGDVMEAMEAAVKANTETRLPLTPTQRKNAAWKLVWLYSDAMSIRRTAQAAGVSKRFVSIMRARASLMKAQGQDWTGNWYNDQRDHGSDQDQYQEMTNGQRKSAIKQLSKDLQKAAGMWPKKDREVFADALDLAFGPFHRDAAEYLYGDGDKDYFSTLNQAETVDINSDF